MNLSKFWLLILVAGFTIPAAVMQGKLTDRWNTTDYFAKHIEHLDDFPTQIGDWKLQDELPDLSEYIQSELQFKSHVNRIYQDSQGNQITMLIMVGSAGPLIRHPVEVCYDVRVRQLLHSQMLDFENDQGEQKVRVHRYEPNSLVDDEFYVAYAYCVNGKLDAPKSPRIKYGAERVLYKIQILASSHDTGAEEVPDSIKDFTKLVSEIIWPAAS